MKHIIQEQIDFLISLQDIEMEIERINIVLGDMPKKIEVLYAGLSEFEKTIKEKETTLNELKKEYRVYESDVQMNLSRIKKNQEKLVSVKTNKEYQALLKEMEALKAKNSQIEDKMLEYLDIVDAAEKGLSAGKNELAKLKVQIEREKEDLELETKKEKEKLERLNADRNKSLEKIENDFLKTYNTIKIQQKGMAIVPVRDAVCQGCYMNIPPQLYNELHSCDVLRFCPWCQRIIYWKES